MVDPKTVPLAERSLRFPDGQFRGTTQAGNVEVYRHHTRVNREVAATSAHPLLCVARAAWWAAAADAAAARALHA